MSNHQLDVQAFMQAAGQYDPAAPLVDPKNLTEEDLKTLRLRLALHLEEFEELFEATLDPKVYNIFKLHFEFLNKMVTMLDKEDIVMDRVAIFDSLIDQDYINCGTAVWLNLPLEEGFKAVHENNMTKIDAKTGKVIRRADGKIQKPSGYQPVDLATILNK